jgi:hypothetical protein
VKERTAFRFEGKGADSEHEMLTSQYFLRHSDRRHLHPAAWDPLARESKAVRFLDSVSLIALSRVATSFSVFMQSAQLQPSQNTWVEKHSQYSLRHLDFLQLHVARFCFEAEAGGGFGLGFSLPAAAGGGRSWTGVCLAPDMLAEPDGVPCGVKRPDTLLPECIGAYLGPAGVYRTADCGIDWALVGR